MVEIVGLGTERDPASILLATKEGNYIPNVRRRTQPPAIMREAVRIHSAEHPSMRVRSLSSEYNCVGLVFASRRTWVDPELVPMILKEDGYRRIQPSEVESGDVLVYRNATGELVHLAIVLDHYPDVVEASWKSRVVSQWGGDGEYLHDANDVSPFLGNPVEFWTERRT